MSENYTCYFDIHCPGSKECYGGVCHCHTIYGWRGENCEEFGPQSYLMLFICGFYFIIASYALKETFEEIKNYIFISSNSSQKLIKYNITFRGKLINTQTIYTEKSVLLYCNIITAILVLSSDLLMALNIFSKENFGKILLENRSKTGNFSRARNITANGYICVFYWLFLQVSLTWLKLGLTGGMQNNREKLFFVFKCLIRALQSIIPVIMFLATYENNDPFYTTLTGFPIYIIIMLIFIFSKYEFQNTLKQSKSVIFLHQAEMMNIVFQKLIVAFTFSQIMSMPVAILLYSVENLYKLKLVAPEEGNINLFFSIGQITRDGAATFVVFSILQYLVKIKDKPSKSPKK
eukprot:snap_masked-scaffold_11-processed-gene-11.8-mRNA-1 protein AED:1.00 eAED:1.00 QI:0/0/0/0/1/1/2/0/347